MKMDKNLSDPGSRVPGSWQDYGHFSRNFGAVKDRIEWDGKGEYKRNALQQIKKMHLSYFWLGSGLKGKDFWDPGTCLGKY